MAQNLDRLLIYPEHYLLMLMVLFGLIGILAFIYFTRKLQENDFVSWKILGSPTLFSSKSIRDHWNMFTFVLFRRYKHIEDKGMVIAGNLIIICIVTNVLLFIYLALFGNYDRYHFNF